MTVWADVETGELVEGACPHCAQHEEDVGRLELQVRTHRRKIAALEKKIDGDTVARRDQSVLNEIVAYWIEKCGKAQNVMVPIRGVRATCVFRILEAGATVERWKLAIDGAALRPYLLYGARVAKAGGQAKRADDLKDIGKDEAVFEQLAEIGTRGA